MQRTGINRNRLIIFIVAIIGIAVFVLLDRLTKNVFADLYEKNGNTVIIKDFFFFSLAKNSGSAYGFLSDVSWGQTFFKILTPVALVAFFVVLYFSVKLNYKTLLVGISLVISGTIGNFIDRIFFGEVTDFIVIRVGGVDIFGIFNLADVLMTVGIILVFVHLLFLGKDALFKGKNGNEKNSVDKPDDEN